ncbi:MAG TPA: SHOCT domain-containing protein [Jiangellaceae bacterium]|nr:SHOCT domain-containing protein [Jiangellaceae bacterium]
MGLVRGMARTAVIAGTATAVSNNVSRRQARRWQQQEYEQQAPPQYAAPPPPPPPPAASAGGGDLTAELERLGALRSSGVITEEEFAAAKAKLLGI